MRKKQKGDKDREGKTHWKAVSEEEYQMATRWIVRLLLLRVEWGGPFQLDGANSDPEFILSISARWSGKEL